MTQQLDADSIQDPTGQEVSVRGLEPAMTHHRAACGGARSAMTTQGLRPQWVQEFVCGSGNVNATCARTLLA